MIPISIISQSELPAKSRTNHLFVLEIVILKQLVLIICKHFQKVACIVFSAVHFPPICELTRSDTRHHFEKKKYSWKKKEDLLEFGLAGSFLDKLDNHFAD